MSRVGSLKLIVTCVGLVSLAAAPLLAQSPAAAATATINGKALAVR